MKRIRIFFFFSLLLPILAFAQNAASPAGQSFPFKITEQRQRCINYQPLRQAFFGELHLHTEYSADAATLDTRNTPTDAYRFARGGVVGLPPFVDTRDALEKQAEANPGGQTPVVSLHPYCLPPDHCEFTATREVQFPEGRQLDFAAITDHAEFFGETNICFYESTTQCSGDSDCAQGQTCFGAVGGNKGQCVPAGYASAECTLLRGALTRLRVGGLGMDLLGSYVTSEFPQRLPFCHLPGSGGQDTCTYEAQNVWQEIQRAAEEAYDRTAQCGFTSFIAYEYTGQPSMGECVADASPCFANADCGGTHGGICCTSPDTGPGCKALIFGGGNNLHRNIIFRNDDVIDLPISYMEKPTGCGKGADCAAHQGGALASPQALLTELRSECIGNPAHPRCDVLTIPHNSNISGGAMFLVPESLGEASIRAQMEPLVELFQIKGTSECRFSSAGLWGTTDEQCSFETLDFAKLAGPFIPQPNAQSILPNSFVRNVLKEGLKYQHANGINPFKAGFVGATDNHNGTPSATDAEMYSKAAGHGDLSFVVSGEALNDAFLIGLETNGGGITGVWAEENSRDSIFEALKRRESFATSGTRPVVRFFGGFDLPNDICHRGDFALQGYTHGVPMGGTLSGLSTSPPRFAVAAAMDPGWREHPGTPLQSIQIIKGWVDKAGQTHESVVNVAGNPNTGETVNLRNCRPSGGGHRDLCAQWTDPNFNPAEPAFYYARVLENASCRWNQFYCNAREVNCSVPFDPNANYTKWEYQQCCSNAVPKTVQQRAWTSPIWYKP
jgi:uncharacterized protein DUF3604